MEKSKLMHITERNDIFQIIQALKLNRKKRNEAGELFVEGIESIKQALTSRRFRPAKVLFADYERLSDWAKQLIADTPFTGAIQLKKELYDELSDKDEPSELMVTLRFERVALTDVALPANPFVVIFDRPSDHGNLGSLLRSANSFGVDLFITHGHCVDFFDPKVIRSSLGAVFHTPIVHEESFAALEAWLAAQKKATGLTVTGSDSGGDASIKNTELSRPIALVLGNEAKGMSVNLKALTDNIINIPMTGAVNSLNVACAGSILFWQVAKNTL